jgi:hypothetical protein
VAAAPQGIPLTNARSASRTGNPLAGGKGTLPRPADLERHGFTTAVVVPASYCDRGSRDPVNNPGLKTDSTLTIAARPIPTSHPAVDALGVPGHCAPPILVRPERDRLTREVR